MVVPLVAAQLPLFFTIKFKRNNLRHELKKYMLKRALISLLTIFLQKTNCDMIVAFDETQTTLNTLLADAN
jgi:hypothetical protein